MNVFRIGRLEPNVAETCCNWKNIRLAPTWHPQSLLDQSWHSRDSVQHVLRDLSPTFVMPVDLLVEALRSLKPGEYFSALCNTGAVEHSDDTRWSFHGTSFAAMYSILLEGFLGVFGAGRLAALKKFGTDVPVVYVSPKYECAARYPLALATRQGEVLGEFVADDVYPLRVLRLGIQTAYQDKSIKNQPPRCLLARRCFGALGLFRSMWSCT